MVKIQFQFITAVIININIPWESYGEIIIEQAYTNTE